MVKCEEGERSKQRERESSPLPRCTWVEGKQRGGEGRRGMRGVTGSSKSKGVTN